MGYPNPAESPLRPVHDRARRLRPSTALGLKVGDELAGASDRHSVAVIGDGALPSGIVFEAFNHASGLKKKMLVILNDNKMSICPRVGGLAEYLDRARMSGTYNDWNKRVKWLLPNIPLVGEHADRWFQQVKDAIKASLHHGMLFEELGFVYIGPIDGHDLKTLRSYLERVKAMEGPVLLHVLTNKGHGFEPAMKDPVKFHAPAPFQQAGDGIIPLKTSSSRTYTDAVSDVLFEACGRDPRVAVITAAMCEGNKLQRIRDTFPDQFFDVGICESHAVAFAAGMAKTGAPAGRGHLQHVLAAVLRPDLPGSGPARPAGRLLPRPRRAGRRRRADSPRLVRPGLSPRLPEHGRHGPGRREGHRPDVRLRPRRTTSPVSIRYPRANLDTIERDVQPVELGQAEILEWETDGMLLACGAMVGTCLRVAERLRQPLRPAGRRDQRPVRQAARPRDHRQGDRGVRLRPDGRGGLPDGRLRLGGARGGQRRRAPHAPTSAGSACPTATSSTPSATSSSPRSAWTSKASPARPWSWPGPSGCPSPSWFVGHCPLSEPAPDPFSRTRREAFVVEPRTKDTRTNGTRGLHARSWTRAPTASFASPAACAEAPQAGHPGQRDQGRGPCRGQDADGSPVRDSRAGAGEASTSRPTRTSPTCRPRWPSCWEATAPCCTRRVGWGTGPRRPWESTSAGSGSSPT